MWKSEQPELNNKLQEAVSELEAELTKKDGLAPPPPPPLPPIPNPLLLLRGKAEIKPDMGVVCETTSTVGCSSYPVRRGKWYYEVLLLETGGYVRIGWCDPAFNGADEWLGDDSHSWA